MCFSDKPGRLFLLASLVALGLPAISSANTIGMNVIAQPLTRERISTLPKKAQKAWLEYLERSEKQKAIDKQTLANEQKAAGNTSPKHASGGRGMYVLRADHPADWWTSDEAIKGARNIVTYQVPDGGWSKNIDMVTRPRAPGDLYDADNENRFPDSADFDKPVDPNWHYIATLDNDSTWMQIRFLARVTTALLAAHRDADAAPFRASVNLADRVSFDSQYPNGGWPQVWPLEGGYHDAITINDDAMTHAVEILHDVAVGAADYSFLPNALRRRAAASGRPRHRMPVTLQIVENGVKTAWAQQYDALTLEPTSARNYEMAALTQRRELSNRGVLHELADPRRPRLPPCMRPSAWFTKVEIYGRQIWQRRLSAPTAQPGRAQTGGRAGRRTHLVPLLPDRHRQAHLRRPRQDDPR